MSTIFIIPACLLQVEITEEHIQSYSSKVESSNNWQDTGVGELFGLFLKRHWPSNGEELFQEEILKHVLLWKPMAQYFRYFGRIITS